MEYRKIYFVFLIFFHISEYRSQKLDNYCYVKDDQMHVLFNKYTPYEFIYCKNKLEKIPDACVPIHLTMISRSGNHYPGAKTMKEINDIIPAIRDNLRKDADHLCSEDVHLINSYNYDMNESMAKKLTSQGTQDFFKMAKRKMRDFPEIFNRPYSPNAFKFFDGGSRSTKESALAFALGLWNFSDIVFEKSDAVLLKKLKDTCRGFKHSDDVMQQYINFFNSEILAKSVLNINRRLGYNDGSGLTKEQVNTLFKACGFDTARNLTGKSPYCVPFTPQDLQIFDYLQDLLRYHRYIRGKQESGTLARPLLSQIYDSLNKIVSQGDVNAENPVGAFYFPFWGIRNSIFASLGLIGKDLAISSSNYNNEMQREFKSSQLDPYSSNIDIILYKCESGEKFRIMVRLQEKPVSLMIEQSDNTGLYSWQRFSAFMKSLISSTTSFSQFVTPTPATSDGVSFCKNLLPF